MLRVACRSAKAGLRFRGASEGDDVGSFCFHESERLAAQQVPIQFRMPLDHPLDAELAPDALSGGG